MFALQFVSLFGVAVVRRQVAMKLLAVLISMSLSNVTHLLDSSDGSEKSDTVPTARVFVPYEMIFVLYQGMVSSKHQSIYGIRKPCHASHRVIFDLEVRVEIQEPGTARQAHDESPFGYVDVS